MDSNWNRICRAMSLPHDVKVSSAAVSSCPRTEGEILLRRFFLNELKMATWNFHPDNMVGEGGFGSVFKGWVDDSSTAANPGKGMLIAVKRINKEGFLGHELWLTEIYYLGRLRHPNLVKLLGYCFEDDHRLLVFEFMSRGSNISTCHFVKREGNKVAHRGAGSLDKSLSTVQQNLVDLAKPYLASKRRVLKVFDPRLKGQYSVAGALKAANLAKQCLSEEPEFRPNMTEMVKALEQLQEPEDMKGLKIPQNEPCQSLRANSNNRRRSTSWISFMPSASRSYT
ncbi:probable serine/threonine-protein kinase PBL11 [Rosa chinensis]|uniref:probable serine/threonine-protein kinase PBL11 n=1 Tax=Rosa chinensis TaxID=74649 RepID=UPI001AD9404B|nr:probable serine/threonine-protein kinase PBL11 [Rosa chinensis]